MSHDSREKFLIIFIPLFIIAAFVILAHSAIVCPQTISRQASPGQSLTVENVQLPAGILAEVLARTIGSDAHRMVSSTAGFTSLGARYACQAYVILDDSLVNTIKLFSSGIFPPSRPANKVQTRILIPLRLAKKNPDLPDNIRF